MSRSWIWALLYGPGIDMDVNRAKPLVLLTTFFLVSTLFLSALPAGATEIPSSFGDWTVSSVVTYNGGTSTITGDIVVESGGTLTLNNLNIIMEGSAIDDLSITVKQGGSLFIHNSVIKAADPIYTYLFVYESGSTGLITGSTIQNVGSANSVSGLTIEDTADVTLKETTLKDNYHGLIADGSKPDVANCTISDGYGSGILGVNGARPVIKNTVVTRFTSGTGIHLIESDSELFGNTLANNMDGLGLYDSQAMVEENIIRNNVRDGVHVERSAIDLVTSEVLENGRDGINAIGASFVIESSDIKDSGSNGIMAQESTMLVRDLVIQNSGSKDLSMKGDTLSLRSHVTFINTTFDTMNFLDPNVDSLLEVYWYVSVLATYESDGDPVPSATVWLTDKDGDIDGPYYTAQDGTRLSQVLSYDMRTTGLYPKTPHTITVKKGDETQNIKIDISEKGADLKLVFDDVLPFIEPDTYPDRTNKAEIELTGTVASDTEEVRLDDAPATLVGSKFTGTVKLEPGKNTIKVEAEDHVKNINVVEVTIIRDIVPPKLIITEPVVVGDNPLYTNRGYITLAVQTEPNAHLFINGDKQILTMNWDCRKEMQLDEGQNMFIIKAQDKAENTATQTVTVHYDPNLPELTILSPAKEYTNQETITLVGTVDDSDTEVFITVNGVGTPVVLSGLDIVMNLKLQEGSNLISVKATDLAGNSVTTNVAIILDTIAPQLIIASPEEGKMTSAGTIHVSGMTDENAYLDVNGGETYYRDGLDFSAPVELTEGKNMIEVTCWDEAGNSNTERVTVFRDSTSPFIEITQPEDGFVTSGESMVVQGSLSEEAGLTMNGHAVNLVDDSFDLTVKLDEGRNLFVFEARDVAGNIGATSISIVKDSIVLLEVYRVEWASKDHYTISGRTDPDSTLLIDGDIYEVGPNGFFIAIANIKEGTDFTIEVMDGMGNTDQRVLSSPPQAPAAVAFDWSPIVLAASLMLVMGAVGAVGGTERGKLFVLFFLFVPLYAKMKKNTVLDHYTRGQIHGYIVANPGDHYNSIKQALKLNNGTLAYHIRVLEKEGIVKSKVDGIYKRFYPAGMKVPEDSGTRLTEIQKIIIKRIKETPGISQKEMSRLVGVSPSTINYHIGILKSAGLVRSERHGMRIGYYLEKPENMPAKVKERIERRGRA